MRGGDYRVIKKLILSLAIITAVGATGVSATQALLNDQAVLGESTFTTGTVNLLISSGGNYEDTSDTGFTALNLRPGTSKDFDIWLKNGTSDVVFKLDGKALGFTQTGGITTSQVKVKFTEVNTDGSPLVGGATVQKTLSTWAGGDPFGTGFNLPANSEQRYKMNVELDDAAPTGEFKFSFEFTGTQVIPPTPTVAPTP